jgi:hypothetical protein
MRRTRDFDSLEEALAAWNEGQRALQSEPAVTEKSTLVTG